MASKVPCGRCRRVGVVRSERVQRGDLLMDAHRCDRCNYSWQVPVPKADKGSGVQVEPNRAASRSRPKK